jgi:hypothetical protein
MSVRGQVVHTDEFGVTRMLSDDEAREYGAFDRNNALASDNAMSTQKRTFVQTLEPISSVAPHGFKLTGTVLLKMLSALSSPAVIWAILASSISLGMFSSAVMGLRLQIADYDRRRHLHVVDLRNCLDRRIQLETSDSWPRERKLQ